METKVYEKIIELLSIYAKSDLNKQERIKEIIKNFYKKDNEQLNKKLCTIIERINNDETLSDIEISYYEHCNSRNCADCKYSGSSIRCTFAFAYDWLKEHNKIKEDN